jgi:cytochrome oxidase Cu insertion factor (SCO1/SenC/PrrC family)
MIRPDRSAPLPPLLAVFALFALFANAAPAGAQPPQPSAPTGLALGSPLPMGGVEMKNIDGRALTLAKAAGKKGTLVLFICNHCPWVKMWQPRLAEVGNAALRQGVGVIAVNPNDPADYPEDEFGEMVRRAKDVGYRFPYVVDATSDVARAFGASHTPEAFLFDARGRLVYHGAVDDNAREPQAVKSRWLADAVAAVAAGKPVPVAESKALGCSIKFREKRSD